jgi:hypothetical protein
MHHFSESSKERDKEINKKLNKIYLGIIVYKIYKIILSYPFTQFLRH